MIKALLFDLDGVLTDTERLGGKMIDQAARLQGFSITEEEWKPLVGIPMINTAHAIARKHPSADIPRLMEDWKCITLNTVKTNGVPEKEGASALLHYLKGKGFLLGLCTNNTRSVISEYLKLLSWDSLFDVILCADDVKERKPAPDTYLLAASRLSCDPRECAGIEDSTAGLLSVHHAGMHSILIPDLVDVPEDTPRDITLPNLYALPKHLESLNKKEG